MHDGGHQRPNLVTALPAIIDFCKARGYRFVDMRGGSGLKPNPANVVDWRHSPTGTVGPFAGASRKVTVTGWTFDVDEPTRQLTVAVFVDGLVRGRAVADLRRADVAAKHESPGAGHGFRLTVPAPKGSHAVRDGEERRYRRPRRLGCITVGVR